MNRNRKTLCGLVLAALLPLVSTSCATIVGTAVSPVTGGVDLTRIFVSNNSKSALWAVPFVFVGGAIGGPFVAFFNGVNYDVTFFRSAGAYWGGFGDIFKPYEMIQGW